AIVVVDACRTERAAPASPVGRVSLSAKRDGAVTLRQGLRAAAPDRDGRAGRILIGKRDGPDLLALARALLRAPGPADPGRARALGHRPPAPDAGGRPHRGDLRLRLRPVLPRE